MASSGSIKTTYIGTIFGDIDAVLSWERTSVDFATKKSVIAWNLSLVSNGDFVALNGDRAYTVQIGGKKYEGKVDANVGSKQTATLLSGTETLTHTADGALTFAYSFTLQKNLSKDTVSASGVAAVDPIPKKATLLTATDFYDTENPYITYTAPTGVVSGLHAGIAFGTNEASPEIAYKAIDITKTNATIELTADDRKLLRQQITTGNSMTVRIYLRTSIGNYMEYSYLTKTVYLVDYTPTLSPEVKDVNTTTIALTGDENKLVRYYSDVQFSTGAAARKEATLVSQSVSVGNRTIENASSGTIDDVANNSFTFSATDSRGYNTQKLITKEMIPYVKLTAALNVEELGLDGKLIFSIRGNYFNGSFGTKNNSLAVKYTLKKNGQLLKSETLNTASQGALVYGLDTYNYQYSITGLVLEESDGSINDYTLQAEVNDLLSDPIITEEITTSGTPIFEWGKDDFTFNVPVHFGRGFIDNTGLKTASLARTLTMNAAGSYNYCDLSELGISSDNTIYSITGAVNYNGKIYPVPSAALGTAGLENLPDATKLWIDGSTVKMTVGAAWGTARVCLVIMYF